MKLITKRTRIQGVCERYREQYYHTARGWQKVGTPSRKVSAELNYDRLMHLDLDTCDEQDIADIIGNDSWTRIRCDECKRWVERAVYFGSGMEGSGMVCPDCLAEAARLLELVEACDGCGSVGILGTHKLCSKCAEEFKAWTEAKRMRQEGQ